MDISACKKNRETFLLVNIFCRLAFIKTFEATTFVRIEKKYRCFIVLEVVAARNGNTVSNRTPTS